MDHKDLSEKKAAGLSVRSSELLMAAVVCSVFGFTLQPVAQRALSADRAGMFSVLNPLAAIVWGRLVLAEPITPVKLLGAALVLTGILYPNLAKEKAAGV